jgi:hypothetical protein
MACHVHSGPTESGLLLCLRNHRIQGCCLKMPKGVDMNVGGNTSSFSYPSEGVAQSVRVRRLDPGKIRSKDKVIRFNRELPHLRQFIKVAMDACQGTESHRIYGNRTNAGPGFGRFDLCPPDNRNDALVNGHKGSLEINIAPSQGTGFTSAHSRSCHKRYESIQPDPEFNRGSQKGPDFLDTRGSDRFGLLVQCPVGKFGVSYRIREVVAAPFARQAARPMEHGPGLTHTRFGETRILQSTQVQLYVEGPSAVMARRPMEFFMWFFQMDS